MYCVVGCAASPSSVTRPKLHWPIGSRSAVAQRFQLLGRSISWRALRADALEVALHFFLAAFGHAPLFLLAAVEGDDHVVLLAAAQRVVHQVAVGPDPDAGGVPAQVFGEVGLVDHRAVDHVAGHARLVAHELLAHHRLHAVGADQRQAAVGVAVLVVHGHAVRVLLDARHAGGGDELDVPAGLHAFEQATVCTSARWITA